MKYICSIVIAATVLNPFVCAAAGPSGTTPSGGSRASPPSATRSTPSSTSPQRPTAGGTRSDAQSLGASSSGGTTRTQAGRLLLARAPAAPARVAQAIKEQGSSSTGWISAAVLVALLSQPDLSSGDRSWIEERLAELGSDGEDDQPRLLCPHVANAEFVYSGLQPTYRPGESIDITAMAKSHGSSIAPISCAIDAVPKLARDTKARIAVATTDPTVYLLNCEASIGGGTVRDRRLIRVVASKVGNEE